MMDIKQIAIEAKLIRGKDLETTYSDWEKELNIFAQKIIAAYNAEWIAEPVAYFQLNGRIYEQTVHPINDIKYIKEFELDMENVFPLYTKPKEMK